MLYHLNLLAVFFFTFLYVVINVECFVEKKSSKTVHVRSARPVLGANGAHQARHLGNRHHGDQEEAGGGAADDGSPGRARTFRHHRRVLRRKGPRGQEGKHREQQHLRRQSVDLFIDNLQRCCKEKRFCCCLKVY